MVSQDNNNKSTYVALSHNVNNLVYHFVTPAKYRRIVFDESVEESLREICLGIELRYDYIHFLEIGVDLNHVHFLVQSTPDHSPAEIIRMIKSISARQIFADHPEIKKKLWGGQFWTDGYFVSTCGRNTDENTIRNYVKNQGKQDGEYEQLHLSGWTLL